MRQRRAIFRYRHVLVTLAVYLDSHAVFKADHAFDLVRGKQTSLEGMTGRVRSFNLIIFYVAHDVIDICLAIGKVQIHHAPHNAAR